MSDRILLADDNASMYVEKKTYIYVLMIIGSWIACICAAITLWRLADRIYVAGNQHAGWILGVVSPWSLLPALIITFIGARRLHGWKGDVGVGLALLLSLMFLIGWLGLLLFAMM